MDPKRSVLVSWLVLGGIVALFAAVLWGPMRVAWRCYQLHSSGEREQAELIHKLEDSTTFVVQIVEGSHAGTSCTADTSAAIYDATEPGARLEVVHLDWKPGECELSSTIEASAQFLWVIMGTLAMLLAGIFALGVFLTRSFTRPVEPARLMETDPREVRCPACEKRMDQGYVLPLSGIHWRTLGQPIGLPHALAGLSGTVGTRSRPRLHAFRCVPCETLTVQYGQPRRPPGVG